MAEDKPKKKFPFRIVFFIIVCLSILGVVWYGYYWYTNTVSKSRQAEKVLVDSQNYQILSSQINTELARCQAFIAQEQGEFGQFEYCKRFINWANAAGESLKSNP